jgi:hypothetical protein
MNRVNSSDYIKSKKQLAIYNEIKQNVPTINPVKQDGNTYNSNFRLCLPDSCTAPTDCSGGSLIYSKNYALRLDFNQGKYYRNYKCVCQPQNFTIGCECSTSHDLSIPDISSNCILCSKCAI